VLWLDGIGAMDAAHEAATRQGLASAYIVDAGRTEFSGPTPTVVGMGPCESAALPPQVRCLLDADGGVACPPRTGTA